MKKLVQFALIAGLAVSFADAQSQTPSTGDVGIGASVSSSTSAVNLFYYVVNSFVIEPSLGYVQSKNTVTTGGTSTSYPDTWWYAGIGAFYVVKAFSRLSVQLGPVVQYSSESYQDTVTGDNIQFTYWSLAVGVRLVAVITRNLGVYTSVGGYYYSQDLNDTTASSRQVTNGYGIVTPSIGVVYYLK